METTLKRLTYDLHPDAPAPQTGRFLVSIGKKGIGTIYHISTVRKVNSKLRNRYVLGVYYANELREATEYDAEYEQVWVRGEEQYPLFWYPRKKRG